MIHKSNQGEFANNVTSDKTLVNYIEPVKQMETKGQLNTVEGLQ